MKIKFRSRVTFKKMIEFPTLGIVARAVFHKNNKYYSQVFLDECLYKI